MGKQSQNSTSTTSKIYGNTTTNNPYASATTNNSYSYRNLTNTFTALNWNTYKNIDPSFILRQGVI